jgi:hypothetical protein
MFADAALQEARSKVDNWHMFYAQEYERYRQMYDAGQTDDTKTEFDIALLAGEREAGQELVQAEEDAKNAHERARELGLCIPTSQYTDQDEYQCEDDTLMSMDSDWAERVDRVKIQKWLSDDHRNLSLDDSTLGSETKEYDDWGDDRSVGFGESVSVVALGRDRIDIDRWRAMRCEGAHLESPQ